MIVNKKLPEYVTALFQELFVSSTLDSASPSSSATAPVRAASNESVAAAAAAAAASLSSDCWFRAKRLRNENLAYAHQ